MKKLSVLFAGISSILLLTGCNKTKTNTNTNTNTISENEFAEKLVNTEDPNYSSATIHATENITGTGDFEQNRNEERTEVYTHYLDPDAWIVEGGDSLLRKYIYDFDFHLRIDCYCFMNTHHFISICTGFFNFHA